MVCYKTVYVYNWSFKVNLITFSTYNIIYYFIGIDLLKIISSFF